MSAAEKWIRGIIFTILAGLIALFAISLYSDAQLFKDDVYQPKQVEIFNSQLVGYKDGHKSWSVFAEYIWAGKSRYIYNAERIVSGQIYNKDGDVILRDVKADLINVNVRHKTLKALQGVSGVFIRSRDEDPIFVTAQRFYYYNTTNRVTLEGKMSLVQGDLVISPKDRFSVDLDEDKAMVESGFTIKSSEFSVTGNQLVMRLGETTIELTGGVSGWRLGKDLEDEPLDDREIELRRTPTWFRADRLDLTRNEDMESVVLNGGVQIRQGDKELTADAAHYFEAENMYYVEGDVVFKAASIKWVVDKHKQDQFDNEDVAKRINEPVEIYADRMVFDATTRMVKVVGRVKVKQETMLITCEKLEYNDLLGEMVLIGNVVIDRKGEDITRASRFVMNILSEEAEADGQVESSFFID